MRVCPSARVWYVLWLSLSLACARDEKVADPPLELGLQQSALSSSDWRDIAVEWGFHRRTRASQERVDPLFKCVDRNSDGTFTAHFGYRTASKDVSIPVGRFNQFLPGNKDRGQPSTFRKNTSNDDLFTVQFNGRPLAWFLRDDLIVVTSASKSCTPPPKCPASCDDGNACTIDKCSKNTGFQCVHANASDGRSCGDGDVCNGDEVCTSPASGSTSVCTPGEVLICADDSPCTTDSCDPRAGCKHKKLPAGTSCPAAGACVSAGSCDTRGDCRPSAGRDCDDQNPCTADSCDPASGCKNVPIAAGIACSDGNACNGDEACDGAGSCRNGAPPNCDDGEVCTRDSCSPVSGCIHDGASANGSVCQAPGCGGAACQDGACLPNAGFVCDDGNPCTADACGANGSCQFTPIAAGSSCDDADLCNGRESCDGAGRCVPGVLKTCTAQDSCHAAGICNRDTGVCSNPPAPDNTSCGDFDQCRVGVCTAGSCTPGASKPDGTVCNDAKNCSASSHCSAGACTSESPICRGIKQNDQSLCNLGTGECETIMTECAPYQTLNGVPNKCAIPATADHTGLDPTTGLCMYTRRICNPPGCMDELCNPNTGNCEEVSTPTCTIGGCLNGLGGGSDPCPVSTCFKIHCSTVTISPVNCNSISSVNCNNVKTGSCVEVAVGPGLSFGCQEGIGCAWNAKRCPPAPPCQRMVMNPDVPECCTYEPRDCASEFGNAPGYTYDCVVEGEQGICRAHPTL